MRAPITRLLYFDEFPGWFGVTREWHVHKNEWAIGRVRHRWRVWHSAILAAHAHPDPSSIGVVPERANLINRGTRNWVPHGEMIGALYASGPDLMLAGIVTDRTRPASSELRLLVAGNSQKAVERLGTFAALMA